MPKPIINPLQQHAISQVLIHYDPTAPLTEDEWPTEKYMKLEEKYYKLTLEGLDDVGKNNTIEHSQVQAWVDSLGTKKPLRMPKCD